MDTYVCTYVRIYCNIAIRNSSTMYVCVHRRNRCMRRPGNQLRLLCLCWWRNSTSVASARAVSRTQNKPVRAATKLRMTSRRYVGSISGSNHWIFSAPTYVCMYVCAYCVYVHFYSHIRTVCPCVVQYGLRKN